jgi:hypothetical protein
MAARPRRRQRRCDGAGSAGPPGAHFHPGHYSLSEPDRETVMCAIISKWHSAYPTGDSRVSSL